MKQYDTIVQQAVQTVLETLPDVAGIYLFGSTGTSFETKESDIDLAVLPVSPVSPTQLWTLSQKIAVLLSRDIDLINLKDASTVLRFQIISTGKRIYCNDQAVCDEFEMVAYSSYLRFNEERKEILEAIKNRGQIFNG